MRNTNAINHTGRDADLELIGSLFAKPKKLLIGCALQLVIMSIVYFDTRFAPMLPIMLGTIITGVWRVWICQQFHKSKVFDDATDDDKARRLKAQYWERRYLLPSALAAAFLGIFCFFGLQVAETEMAFTAVMCALFAPVPTIVGGLFGSQKLVGYMLFGMFAPVVGGYFLHGDIPHFILGLICLPYVALVFGMVHNVRDTFTRAAEDAAKRVELGQRFDVALSNMSHGLIMFDEFSRMSVMNDMAFELLGIHERPDVSGRKLDSLLRYAHRYAAMSLQNTDTLMSNLNELLLRQADKKQVLLDDGRYLECNASASDTGGVIIIIEDITERLLAAKKIERLAQFDSLTGLANRQHFESQIDDVVQTASSKEFCSLLVIDIDDFKYVNDAIGHAQGDALLCDVASSLELTDDISHFACRAGGDEFLLFVHGMEHPSDINVIVDGLIDRLVGIHDLNGEQVYVSCSVGHCGLRTADFSHDDMMMRADLALYAAKRKGKGVVVEFEPSMNEQYQRRQLIKKQLGKAVENDELSIIFQPLVDAKTGRLISCEALSRWYDSELGNIQPGEYVPLAEEMGIVTKMSAQTLRFATNACAQWDERVSVSVNLSPVDFRTTEILNVIESALADSGLAPERLEIEITETAVIANEEELIGMLKQISAMGVRIALDDFGTGQSSLSYLHRLPLHKVKIDRSFVVGIDTGATPVSLLRGITDLCRTLNLDVTVEGVETPRQLEIVVNEAQVDRIQGYIFGAGLPVSGINTLAGLNKVPILDSQAS